MRGFVVYDGPSAIDGERIVVIVTALERSRNTKTGDMVATYILRADMHPIEAVRTGSDVSICGSCKHRGDGTGNERSCYVTLAHGPSNVYRSWLRGVYPAMDPAAAAVFLTGKMVRIGTYGDPAAAPLAVWQALIAHAEGWTGYSHRTKYIDRSWARLVMASVDTPEEAREAEAIGYRTFRVGTNRISNEVLCPASQEAGKKTNCSSCRACMGISAKAKVNIYIPPHGAGKKYALMKAA